MRAWRAAIVITAEMIAMAPDNITGRSSQIIPVRPPANARVVTVPMVPMPKIVATMPANEVPEAISLMVPFAMAIS